MFDDFNFGNNVKSKYIDFDFDVNVALENQLDELKEDLLQVQYLNGIVIDIGWYPEFSSQGEFRIFMIKDDNWDSPLYDKKCTSIEKLQDILLKFIKIAQNIDNV